MRNVIVHHVGSHYTERQAETIRAFVRRRRDSRRKFLAKRLETARRDRDAIITEIARLYHPRGIYTWGSLVDDRHFSEMSDIDIALEGITDPASLSAIRGTAERMTTISVDIVALEHVHAAYADFIRRHGRLLHAD